MDADDMSRGWLLRTIFGNKHVVGNVDDDDEESAPALGGSANGNGSSRPKTGTRTGSSKWGSRGISVSADNGVLESERQRGDAFKGQEEGIVDSAHEDADPDAKMKDPDELARILDDDDDDSDDGVLPAGEGSATVGNGAEWREGEVRR